MDKHRISYRVLSRLSELSAIPFSLYRDLMDKKIVSEDGEIVRRHTGAKVNWDKQKYKELFKRYSKKPNPYRIYLPLDATTPQDLTPPKLIVDFLRSKGYMVKDYLTGKAVNNVGREVSIGKIIGEGKNKNPELLKLYANDPQLQGLKGNFLIVISRHSYDILGASTDRGWTSCTQIGILDEHGKSYVQKQNGELPKDKKAFGVNWRYTLADVEKGGLIAYLINPDKQRDKKTGKSGLNPTARLSIRPFIDDEGNQILWHSSTVYGVAPKSFQRTVERWLKDFQRIKNDTVYQIDPDTYAEVKDARIKDRLLFSPNLDLNKFVEKVKGLNEDDLDSLVDELERQEKLSFIPSAITQLEKYDYLEQTVNPDKTVIKLAHHLWLLAQSYDYLFKTDFEERSEKRWNLLKKASSLTEDRQEFVDVLANTDRFKSYFVRSLVNSPRELGRIIVVAALTGIPVEVLNQRLLEIQDFVFGSRNEKFVDLFHQFCDTLHTIGFDDDVSPFETDLVDRYFVEIPYSKITEGLNF